MNRNETKGSSDMNRDEMLSRVGESFDVIIIGGGCSGVGCAVDAASRGYKVLLLEAWDFGKGTSSRSTKLIHGGVRYLRQGRLGLVREALRERELLLLNAPHVVNKLRFIVPCQNLFEFMFYGTGLKLYDFLAKSDRFAKTCSLSKRDLERLSPILRSEKIRNGWIYEDAQFDDARLLIDLVKTAVEQGATVLNYARVFELTKNSQGFIEGVSFVDGESGQLFQAKAKVVINATGAFCDSIRRMSDAKASDLIKPSQGVHLVLRKEFYALDEAILIPKTSDKRVLFVIPWNGHLLVGTTDTLIENVEIEPKPFEFELDFLMQMLAEYFRKVPSQDEILSVFTGIRPLVKDSKKKTSDISRDFVIEVDKSGLVTLTGGKWTTYRLMAEKTIDFVSKLAELPARECKTQSLKIHGWESDFYPYGSDAEQILKLQNEGFGERLHPDLPYTQAEILWAVRHEMARTVEDVLCRRTRALFLNSKATLEIAPQVANMMARELGKPASWAEEQVKNFRETAEKFAVTRYEKFSVSC